MNFFEINIEGKQFEKNYLIYIIKISHSKKGNFYYIGQTGDRHYRTARPAFRRLAGHLSDIGQSTENQVYRQIAEKILEQKIEKNKKFNDNVKNKVSDFLIDSKINMKVFPIIKFDPKIDQEKHIENRRYVENIEKILIEKMVNKNGLERILNKRILKSKSLKDTEKKATEIIEILENTRL